MIRACSVIGSAVRSDALVMHGKTPGNGLIRENESHSSMRVCRAPTGLESGGGCPVLQPPACSGGLLSFDQEAAFEAEPGTDHAAGSVRVAG